MSWNYAELSKLAKESGGPEKLVEMIELAGFKKGKDSMYPVMVGAVVLSLVVGAGLFASAQKISGKLKKQTYSPEELEAAKKEIVEGIKEYDEQHSSDSTTGTEATESQH